MTSPFLLALVQTCLFLLIGLSIVPVFGLSTSGFQNSASPFSHGNNASFLWRINSVPPAFMFGTIHVPYTRVWDAIPSNAKEAFMNARQIYFELDLTSHATIASLSSCQLLPGGQHLSQLLPSDLYLRLKLHLDSIRKAMRQWLTADQQERGFDSDYLFSTMTANWERKRPIWALMMVNSLTKSDIASRGVPVLDLFLSKLAERQKKKLSAIETVEEQCRPLNDINISQVLFALNQTLQYHENAWLGLNPSSPSSLTDYTTDDIISQYRRGNIDSGYFSQDTFQIPSLRLDEQRLSREERQMAVDLDRYFRENLIELRNKRMAARIIDLLVNKPDSYFFALGAGHFVGQKSILEFVKSAGFQVEHISPSTKLDFSSGPSGRRNRIQGTFDDLPDDEKTRALLQFLQYRQHLEKEESTKKFEAMVGGIRLESGDQTAVSSDPTDEKAIEESLKVWYGLNSVSSGSSGILSRTLWLVTLALVTSFLSH